MTWAISLSNRGCAPCTMDLITSNLFKCFLIRSPPLQEGGVFLCAFLGSGGWGFMKAGPNEDSDLWWAFSFIKGHCWADKNRTGSWLKAGHYLITSVSHKWHKTSVNLSYQTATPMTPSEPGFQKLLVPCKSCSLYAQGSSPHVAPMQHVLPLYMFILTGSNLLGLVQQ